MNDGWMDGWGMDQGTDQYILYFNGKQASELCLITYLGNYLSTWFHYPDRRGKGMG